MRCRATAIAPARSDFFKCVGLNGTVQRFRDPRPVEKEVAEATEHVRYHLHAARALSSDVSMLM